MASETARQTVLMIGTRKGLWLATSDGERRDWTVRGPEEPMSEVHAVAIDKRRDTAAARGQQVLALGAPGDPLRRPRRTWARAADGAVKFPEDTETSLEAGLGHRAVAVRAGRGLGGQRAAGAVQVHRLRRDLRDDPGAVEPPAPDRVGRRLRRSGDPHGAAAPDRPAAGHRRDVHRRGLPHPRRRRDLGAGATRASRRSSSPASAVPRVRAVRAQGRPRLRRPGRLYAQNHGGVYRSDDAGEKWTSIANGLPADFGFPVVVHPSRPGTLYVFPLERPRAGSRTKAGPGSTGPGTPASPGRSSARGCRTGASGPR